jgi:hypothetical protein
MRWVGHVVRMKKIKKRTKPIVVNHASLSLFDGNSLS